MLWNKAGYFMEIFFGLLSLEYHGEVINGDRSDEGEYESVESNSTWQK